MLVQDILLLTITLTRVLIVDTKWVLKLDDNITLKVSVSVPLNAKAGRLSSPTENSERCHVHFEAKQMSKKHMNAIFHR